MSKLITIVIPTYNRREDVIKQVHHLDTCITEAGLQEKICVVVSDNHSEDGTYEALLALKDSVRADFTFQTQQSNIGGTFNSRSVMVKATTPFVLLLGDDDYMDPGYLPVVVAYLENNPNITAIFPNFHSNVSPRCRDAVTEDRIYKKGECLGLMFKAHQMSGLVFRLEETLETLFAKHGENRYYQMYCMGFNMLRGEAVHITRLPVCVNETNPKAWTYGKDGLWEDVFMNIQLLDISSRERRKLERYYMVNYGWAAVPRFVHAPVKFLTSLAGLKNLSAGTKWLTLPCMFISGLKIVYLKRIKKVG